MKAFTFGTTLRRADHIKISNQSDLRILFPPYLKNGFSQLKNFLYSFQMLLNLALFSFWVPSANQR
ncbi:hypothetical protein O3M35_009363 [Rhynocoris fuscipes]|uniref:Uncharacterized protein n=1 Tax=Rhynocoris fuscipes TaxID=488301 RepID=A0AAW1D8L3_9HEMI